MYREVCPVLDSTQTLPVAVPVPNRSENPSKARMIMLALMFLCLFEEPNIRAR